MITIMNGDAESEELNMDKNMDWIYAPAVWDPEVEKCIERIEDALGFKLFTWQKHYLIYGRFRRYGQTTAQVLRDLIVPGEPLDYTKRPPCNAERIYREELKEIKKKLDAAGITTRPVFFTRNDKERYLMKKARQQDKEDV